jgi:predicted anti-sigma-YlaC factor YlaD
MTEQFKNPALTTHIEEAALLLFLDGELSSSAAECVEKHLGVCSACRHLCEELREAEELCSQFQQSALVPAPPRNWSPQQSA